MPRTRLAVAYCIHDDAYYLRQSIEAFAGIAPVFVFVSKLPWNDEAGEWERAAREAEAAGANVVLMEHPEELAHREALRVWLAEHGFTHALIPDGDEIIEPELRDTLVLLARSGLAERVTVEFDTYWKSPEYVIRPREALQPQFLIDVRATRIAGIRLYDGGRQLHLTASYGVVHHLSYAGPEERIRRKVSTWSHRPEVRPDWWESVWERWDADHLMRDLHPTHPRAYGFAERIYVPPVLRPAYDRWLELTGTSDRQTAVSPVEKSMAESTLTQAPKRKSRSKKAQEAERSPLSIVIPLHGGTTDIARCLDSLETCRDLAREVIVVDDSSADDAPQEAAKRDWVRVIPNDGERGFAGACNRGLAESTGELILFLNSDTAVPRIGLERLLEALHQADDIAAVGPFTNRAGHGQQISVTYTSQATLDLFAEDFAQRERPDYETDMLTGFCLLVRRRVLDEVGPFDTRFSIGTFEDNDLCYRIRRTGYRLVLAARSFVHHQGHSTFLRSQIDLPALLAHNEQLYREKWHADLDSGFTSHLSGTAADRIRFRRPGAPALAEAAAFGAAPRQAAPELPHTQVLAEQRAHTSMLRDFEAALHARDWAAAERCLETLRLREGFSELWTELSVRLVQSNGGDPESFVRRVLELAPDSLGARLVLVRLLLQKGQEEESVPHLQLLQERGVAESAYYLGIYASRKGEPRLALSWMERALQLNPSHRPTLEHVAALRRSFVK